MQVGENSIKRSLIISAIFIIMLCGTVLSGGLVQDSLSSYYNIPQLDIPIPPEARSKSSSVPDGSLAPVRPSSVQSTGIALAQQSKDVLTGLTIGKDGAVLATFKVGLGKWNTVEITPRGIFPPGGKIAMAKQTDNVLTALAVGNNGAMYVLWVVGTGKWNGPVPISPQGMFRPGIDIAMLKQTNDRLVAFAIGKDSKIYQAWVDGTGEWNKPPSGIPAGQSLYGRAPPPPPPPPGGQPLQVPQNLR